MEDLADEFRRRIAALGYELVDLRRRGSSTRPLIQARIDLPDSRPGHGVGVDDCARVSRALESWLDESKLFGEKYVLEVSSPGIERPVRWPDHWQRFTGRDVNARIAGVGRVRATIVSVSDDGAAVTLQPRSQKEPITVRLDEVQEATLWVDWS